MTKVIVGLSGGVDSAVAAYLLIKQGYEVVGAFMRNWDSYANNDVLGNNTLNKTICPQEEDYNDAKRVAEQLGIPLLRVDFIKEYWDHVFTYFIDEYQKGRTPNPDILCNKYIKFSAFMDFAVANGADYIATGHYAKLIRSDNKIEMHKAFDTNKDQTYFLCLLTKSQLEKTLFPLGDITKPQVREIAKQLKLNVATKKDSTGICFIGERNFKAFLQNYIPAKPGKIIDYKTSKIIGEHIGVMYYTIGQRKGLNIGGLKDFEQDSWYVIGKDIDKSILYVVQGDESKYLYYKGCIVSDLNIINNDLFEDKVYGCKFRYRQMDVMVKIKKLPNNKIEVICLNPTKAITPGQEAVFYDGTICLGGGTIDQVINLDSE